MDTSDIHDWIDLGHISPQEALNSDLGANIKGMALQSWNLGLRNLGIWNPGSGRHPSSNPGSDRRTLDLTSLTSLTSYPIYAQFHDKTAIANELIDRTMNGTSNGSSNGSSNDLEWVLE